MQRRIDLPGFPMHVVHRGVDRQPVFNDDEDRGYFVGSLRTAARRYGVRIHGYVLMSNHVHLLLSSDAVGAIPRAVQAFAGSHGRRFNERIGRTGALWERRFWSGVVDNDRSLLACLAYIELNPVRAGIVAEAPDWPWSSARHHLHLRVDPHIDSHPVFEELGGDPAARSTRWRQILASLTDGQRTARLRKALYEGHAFGSSQFRDRITAETGRAWKPAPRGRPRTRNSV